MLTLKQALEKKRNEVYDLFGRGLLSQIYINAWQDVMKIVDFYPESMPVNKLAGLHKMTVRFSDDSRGAWRGTIRPHGVDAVILEGCTYEDCESKVREWIDKNHHKFEVKEVK